MMILGEWGWWIAAGLLLIAELVLPGVFLVWFGIAAAAVAILHHFVPMHLAVELVIFGAFAVAFALAGRVWLKRRVVDEVPVLNQRQLAHVGRRYKLHEPIRDELGAIIIDDTRWEIVGPDLDAGAWVEVTGADGARLVVKPSEAGFPLSRE